ATVFEEEFPLDTSYYVTLPWLAYASATYIRDRGTDNKVSIPAIWTLPLSDPLAFIFQCSFDLSQARPAVPVSLEFKPNPDILKEVRAGKFRTVQKLSKTDSDLAVLQVQPYASIDVAGEYKVLSMRQIGRFTVPNEFELTRFWISSNRAPRTVFHGKLNTAEV